MVDLFPDAPRRPRRVLMKVTDASDTFAPCHFVFLECEKCGRQHGWGVYQNKREATTQPCPKCNKAAD